MSDPQPIAAFEHRAGQLDATLDFLKQMRYALRELRLARVSETWLRAYDVNGDCCEITGLGYADADVVAVLDALNAAFNRETIHEAVARPFKEFKTGKRRPWAEDRVM
jgi:hypothetical protein